LEDWLSIQQASLLLNLQPRQVRKLVHDGMLLSRSIGGDKRVGTYLVDPVSIREYLAQHPTGRQREPKTPKAKEEAQ